MGIHVHPLIRCKKDDVWVSRAEMRHRMCGLANMSHSNQMHPANTAVVGVRPSPRIIAGVRSGWIPALGNRVSTVRYPIPQRTFQVRCHGSQRDGRDVPRSEVVGGHSITSSAMASSDGGTSRPIAFATIRLTTRSN